MGEENCGISSSTMMPKKNQPTLANVEMISNGYVVFTNVNFGQEQKKIFVPELSELPAQLAQLFGLNDDISNS